MHCCALLMHFYLGQNNTQNNSNKTFKNFTQFCPLFSTTTTKNLTKFFLLCSSKKTFTVLSAVFSKKKLQSFVYCVQLFSYQKCFKQESTRDKRTHNEPSGTDLGMLQKKLCQPIISRPINSSGVYEVTACIFKLCY